jgi:dTDP-4-amino-4,6-dideoxygalactose transaminase
MLVTNDDGLAERARLLRTHGAKQKYYHEWVGANFRLDALQAALLAVKLPYLDRYTRQRRQNAAFYSDQLSKRPGVFIADRLDSRCCALTVKASEPQSASNAAEGAARLLLPMSYPHRVHIWNQFTVRVPGPGRRDALRAFLAEKGIGSEVYYPVPLHRQQCFASSMNKTPVLLKAEEAAAECLSLPIYPELSRQQLQEVVDGITSFLGRVG